MAPRTGRELQVRLDDILSLYVEEGGGRMAQ